MLANPSCVSLKLRAGKGAASPHHFPLTASETPKKYCERRSCERPCPCNEQERVASVGRAIMIAPPASKNSPIAHCLAPILQFEKIAEQVLAGCRENGFGMELHPLHAERSMPEAHDLAFNGLGRHFQAIRNRCPVHQQGVIAGRLKWVGKVMKDGLAVMVDHGGLPVHQAFGMNDFPSEGHRQRLMPETDSQDRDAPGELTDGRHRYPGLFG